MKRPIVENELLKLRKEIPLGSLFVSDYRNTLGVDKEEACIFFDGYLEFLGDMMEEDGIPQDNNFWEHCGLYDTNENLIEWFNCFEECPLYVDEEKQGISFICR